MQWNLCVCPDVLSEQCNQAAHSVSIVVGSELRCEILKVASREWSSGILDLYSCQYLCFQDAESLRLFVFCHHCWQNINDLMSMMSFFSMMSLSPSEQHKRIHFSFFLQSDEINLSGIFFLLFEEGLLDLTFLSATCYLFLPESLRYWIFQRKYHCICNVVISL